MPGPYELYLIRHGIAEERGEAWPDDAKRPLTEEGIARLRKSARGLARLGVALRRDPDEPARPDASDRRHRRRRRSTSVRHIVATESLAPGGTYQAVLADLEKQSRRTRIALVGHEPGIGELAARLSGSRHPLEFKKGAICRIDVDTLPPTGPARSAGFSRHGSCEEDGTCDRDSRRFCGSGFCSSVRAELQRLNRQSTNRYPSPTTVSICRPGGAELAAQAADVHVDRSRFDQAVVAPHAFEQTIARDHAVAVLDEIAEQLEFASRQPDRPRRRRRPRRLRSRRSGVRPGSRRAAAPRTAALRRSTARTRAVSSRRLNGLVT